MIGITDNVTWEPFQKSYNPVVRRLCNGCLPQSKSKKAFKAPKDIGELIFGLSGLSNHELPRNYLKIKAWESLPRTNRTSQNLPGIYLTESGIPQSSRFIRNW